MPRAGIVKAIVMLQVAAFLKKKKPWDGICKGGMFWFSMILLANFPRVPPMKLFFLC